MTPSKLDPNKVYLSSRKKPARKGGKAATDDLIYIIKIGSALWKRTRLKDDAEVKILWGTDNLKGCIRIEPMRTLARGWKVKVAKNTGVRSIMTSALPADCAQAAFVDVPLEFTTKDLSESAIGEKAIEIELPETFFQRDAAAE